jgi:hypothetical protein
MRNETATVFKRTFSGHQPSFFFGRQKWLFVMRRNHGFPSSPGAPAAVLLERVVCVPLSFVRLLFIQFSSDCVALKMYCS